MKSSSARKSLIIDVPPKFCGSINHRISLVLIVVTGHLHQHPGPAGTS
jgi:hypothetical protein